MLDEILTNKYFTIVLIIVIIILLFLYFGRKPCIGLERMTTLENNYLVKNNDRDQSNNLKVENTIKNPPTEHQSYGTNFEFDNNLDQYQIQDQNSEQDEYLANYNYQFTIPRPMDDRPDLGNCVECLKKCDSVPKFNPNLNPYLKIYPKTQPQTHPQTQTQTQPQIMSKSIMYENGYPSKEMINRFYDRSTFCIENV